VIALFTARSAAGHDSATVFVDVNVVPMDSDRVVAHQSVVIRDGKIEVVGSKSSVKAPQGALVIDGRGRYLMPGLVDMHVHFLRPPVPGKQLDVVFPDYLPKNEMFALLYVANGITTVRNMWGHPETDKFKQRILAGEVLGPTIYSTGPITDGEPPVWRGSRVVVTPEQARLAVHDDKANGYVGIKVYDHLSNQSYKAIVAAAADEHLPLMGHLPFAVSLQEAIVAHQASIEHVESFIGELNPDPASVDKKTDVQLWSEADVRKLQPFAAQMKAADVWVCPTIAVYQMDLPGARFAEEMKYIPAEFAERYRKNWDASKAPDGDSEIRLGVAVTRTLHSAGVGLLAGTDTFKPNVVPGFSLHQELNYFVQAGLTPYEAIKAATSDPARFLHREEEFGALAVGRRADLLLLNANPLEDVHNTTKQVGVMVRGKWFPEEELQEKLKKLADQIHHSQ
jgi:imidazolonepropionase-like amidohydrolase